MKAKTVNESRVTVTHQMLPAEANSTGKMHGGQLMMHLDSTAAICAFRHARDHVVTASVEHLEFIQPVLPGDILMFHASVNFVRRTSMEVGVRVEAEAYLTGEIRHVCTCYSIFVGIDKDGNPRPLPRLIAETDEDKRRMADAARRMAISRMGSRKKDSFSQYLQFRLLSGSYAVCLLPPNTALPSLQPMRFMNISQADDEISLVIEEEYIPLIQDKALRIETGFTGLKMVGEISMDMVGVIASISSVLASVSIPVFPLSTYKTDYILFHKNHLETAINMLRSVGHTIIAE